MKEIRLSGISQKGKNRIHEHGEYWDVIDENKIILRSKKESFVIKGIKFFYEMTINPINDPNFKMIK